MNVGYYLLCLLLMLPLAALTAFGALIESLTKLGFWTTLEMVFGTLFDPLGKGIWGVAFLLTSAGLVAAGFFPTSRPFGFLAIAAASLAATGFLYSIFPGDFQWGLLWILSPSVAGFALALYCAHRSFQKAGV